jgi:hypothetical protein
MSRVSQIHAKVRTSTIVARKHLDFRHPGYTTRTHLLRVMTIWAFQANGNAFSRYERRIVSTSKRNEDL